MVEGLRDAGAAIENAWMRLEEYGLLGK